MAAEPPPPALPDLAVPDAAVAVRQLLDQQADIHARLAALLPDRYGPDLSRELAMLRHKLCVLQVCTDHHRISARVPVLSEAEEARYLQYKCECLLDACAEQGVDLLDPSFVDMLKRSLVRDAPEGYADWLDRNLSLFDPVFRGFKVRHSLPPSVSNRPVPSFRCGDESCIHHIYGFLSQDERDRHSGEHASLAKRDSGLSVSSIPRMHFPSDPGSSRLSSVDYSGHHSAIGLPRPSHAPQLPPLSTTGQPRDRRDSLLSSYSIANEHRSRDSVDSEIDPLLPPLKRSRVGPGRLESIGELRLLQDDRCLRCKVLNLTCDSRDACSGCSDPAISRDNDPWRTIGCHRGPLQYFGAILLPEPLSPRQTQTPVTSPLAQRRSVNEFLEKNYQIAPEVLGGVRASIDFDDGFWWTDELASQPLANPGLSGYMREAVERPPPILSILAASRNVHGASYDFLQLLKTTGLLSPRREEEEIVHPVLYRSKLLLREVMFYDLQQPEPSIRLNEDHPIRAIPTEEIDHDGHHRLLSNCVTHFLQAFEMATTKRDLINPISWLAVFLSLCIFSIGRTILVDLSSHLGRLQSMSHSFGLRSGGGEVAIHDLYKVLASMFTAAGPMFLGRASLEVGEEHKNVFEAVGRLVRQDTWGLQGISSAEDFLKGLGSGDAESTPFFGFIRPRMTSRQKTLLLPPIRQPEEDYRQAAPDVRSVGEPWTPSTAKHTDREGFSLQHSSDLSTSPNPLDPRGIKRRHTVAESPTYSRDPSRMEGSPLSKMRPTYQRPPLRRVYCNKCNEYPEGFRGEHELRRHTEAKHVPLVKRWICTEPENIGPEAVQPVIPLTKCKACLTQKRYGAYYNAAAHLRRAHFNPHRGNKASGDWPPMNALKDWMTGVRQSVDTNDNDLSSGDEAEFKSEPAYYGPEPRRSPIVEPARIAPAPTAGPPLPPPGPLLAPRETIPTHPPVPVPGAPAPAPMSAQSSSPPPPKVLENRSRCPHPDCGRVFKDLASHMLTHQEERPEKCPIETCEYHVKGFARKYDKNRHALTHFKGNMVCPFCPGAGTAYEKAFNRADVFKRHLTTMHQVEQAPPNSRKIVSALPRARANGAECSICQSRFATAQEFYEHLDDCVLSVLVPGGSGSGASKPARRDVSIVSPTVPFPPRSRTESPAPVVKIERGAELSPQPVSEDTKEEGDS